MERYQQIQHPTRTPSSRPRWYIWLLIPCLGGWCSGGLSYAYSSRSVERDASVGVSPHDQAAGQLWAARGGRLGDDEASILTQGAAKPWFMNDMSRWPMGVRDDMGLSIALQYQQPIYRGAEAPPGRRLQPRFEPALKVSVALQGQELIVVGDGTDAEMKMVGGITPDGLSLLLRMQWNDEWSMDGQGALPAVWLDGLINYLKAKGVIDVPVRDVWIRDVRFVAKPIHNRPYVSVEFAVSDGQQVLGFNVCVYELRAEQPAVDWEATWKVGLKFKPWLYQDGLRWLATLRPLNRWPDETIWWFVASPGVEPAQDEESLTTMGALQQYYADVMIRNVGAALASWNLYRRESSARAAAAPDMERYSEQIHTLIGWIDTTVRLGDFGYSYVVMPLDQHSNQADAHTTWSYQPDSGRIDSAIIAITAPQLNEYMSESLLKMSPQAARDELSRWQPWQAQLAHHRAELYHEVGHAMGAEDNLKGSMVPHDQAITSGMDELHPVVAEMLFAQGALQQPLSYDQTFVDMAYHGQPAAEIEVHPRCTQDLWPAATDAGALEQVSLAVWEQLQGAMDPFCQRGDLFYSLSDGVDLLSRSFTEEVKLAGQPIQPVLSSVGQHFASHPSSSEEGTSELWWHSAMQQHYSQMIRGYMVDESPSYADLIYTTMYWLLLWPRYGMLFDAEREANVIARYMRAEPYRSLSLEHGPAGLNWFTQASELLVKSGLDRFGIPLQYALFYTQQRTLLFGLYKDVIRALAGGVDGFEVLPTPLHLAEQTCTLTEMEWMFGDEDCLEVLTEQTRGVMMEIAPSLGAGYVTRLSQLVQLAQNLPRQSQQVFPALLGLNVLRKLMTELMSLYDFETIVLDKDHWFSHDAASRVAMELFYVLVAAGTQVQPEIPGVDNEWVQYKEEMLRRLYIKQGELVAQLSTDDDSALVILDDRRGQWDMLDLELQYLETLKDKLQSIGVVDEINAS